MNRKRLLQLARDLEAHKDNGFRFNMGTILSNSRNPCQTTGCIAGFVMVNYLEAKFDGYYDFRFPDGEFAEHHRAGDYLGLSPQQHSKLFFDYELPGRPLTAQDAARVIRRLARTGKVEWNILKKRQQKRQLTNA